MSQTPVFACQFCGEEVTYPASDLHIWNGEPLCECCYDERRPCADDDDNYPPEWAVDWGDLPEFVPEYVKEIERLKANPECIHCGAFTPDSDHWRVCENHPARAEIERLNARVQQLLPKPEDLLGLYSDADALAIGRAVMRLEEWKQEQYEHEYRIDSVSTGGKNSLYQVTLWYFDINPNGDEGTTTKSASTLPAAVAQALGGEE